MDRHTPGPWEVTWDEYGGYDCMSAAHDVRAVGSLHSICTLDNGGKFSAIPDEQCAVDAKLIAAAPDLLEALKGVLRVADRATVEFDAARAAIALATPPQGGAR